MPKSIRVSLISLITTIAAAVAGAAPYDQVIGVAAPGGGAVLVKRVAVPAGTVIRGAEVVSNDLRTTFPRVTLYRGRTARLSDATVVQEFVNVRASTRHTVALSCTPIEVRVAQEFYVAISWPVNDQLRGTRDGAAIPAVLRADGGDSYIASGPDKDLQRIEGLDLGVRLITEGGVAKSGAGIVGGQEPKHWRTFLSVETMSGGQTTLRFGVETRSRVVLRLYDVGGRCIRTLNNEDKDPGEYALEWDGRTEAGAPVPAGVYLARFAVGAQTFKHKIVVAR